MCLWTAKFVIQFVKRLHQYTAFHLDTHTVMDCFFFGVTSILLDFILGKKEGIFDYSLDKTN